MSSSAPWLVVLAALILGLGTGCRSNSGFQPVSPHKPLAESVIRGKTIFLGSIAPDDRAAFFTVEVASTAPGTPSRGVIRNGLSATIRDNFSGGIGLRYFVNICEPADDSATHPGHYRFVNWDNELVFQRVEEKFQKIKAPPGSVIYMGELVINTAYRRLIRVNMKDAYIAEKVEYQVQDKFNEAVEWFKKNYPDLYAAHDGNVLNHSPYLLDGNYEP